MTDLQYKLKELQDGWSKIDDAGRWLTFPLLKQQISGLNIETDDNNTFAKLEYVEKETGESGVLKLNFDNHLGNNKAITILLETLQFKNTKEDE